MKRVAVVVQRCHESVVGGSEALAWQYATLLRDAYEVDVLTTTAVDAAYWSNVLPEGLEVRDRINVRRFHVDVGYSPYRTELWSRMMADFGRLGAGSHNAPDGGMKHIPWPVPLQEELIRHIGPYSESLVRHLRRHAREYRAIIFVTYLYPTAYFGLLEVPRGRALFVPTLHDEQPAYFSVYKHAARRAHSLIWLTEAERQLGHDFWGKLPGRVISMAIDAEPREPAPAARPYLLYCGRIDPNKGCDELFDYFARFKEESASPLGLVLTGKADVPVPDHPWIEFRGFVTDEEKFGLMAGAAAYVMPSARESFSIVTLEAMAQRTPVLVSGASQVLADHVRQSGGGLIYHDYETFAAAVDELTSDEAARARMGEWGREYVVSRYTPERVRELLIEAVESCPPPGEEPRAASEPKVKLKVKETAEFPSFSPPLPVPRGWTEEGLRALVTSVRVEDAPDEEMKSYAESDFRRFVYTLGLVPERTGMNVLELGANPYFTTVLLSKFRDARLTLANHFGDGGRAGTQRVTIHQTGETVEYAYDHFNVEADAFPYTDESFDVVLFCEIIEHLLSDPVRALVEIRRVLKPGGTLVLTTPNVARLDNVRKVVAGQNVYDPYSGYGPYGRHNREYTQEELFALLDANGFSVRTMFTADVHPSQAGPAVPLSAVAPLLRRRSTDLGQYIFCQASVNRESKRSAPARPGWLYRSMPQDS